MREGANKEMARGRIYKLHCLVCKFKAPPSIFPLYNAGQDSEEKRCPVCGSGQLIGREEDADL